MTNEPVDIFNQKRRGKKPRRFSILYAETTAITLPAKHTVLNDD